MSKPESGRIQAFIPTAHHTRPDDLVIYWFADDDRAVVFESLTGVLLLRADADLTRITGIRISSFHYRYVRTPPTPEPPPPAPNRANDGNPELFKPYVWYNRADDTTVIRWQAGAVKEELLKPGARITLLRDVSSMLLFGAVLHNTSKILRK